MTSTNIQIMEENAENKLFTHIAEVSVCAQPVRPVQLTGQTGLHGTVHVGYPVRPVEKIGQTGHTQKLSFTAKSRVTNP